MFLDTDKAIQSLRARAAATENAAARRNLEVVIRHMETERDRDLDACMETVSENAVYYQWGGPNKVQPRGREQVRIAYTASFKERRGSYLQYDLDRIVADER